MLTFNQSINQSVYFRRRGPYKNTRDRWTDRKQQTGRTAQHKTY